MMYFLKNLWFMVWYQTPYHEHIWEPTGDGWVCSYEDVTGVTCPARSAGEWWL